MGKKLRVVGLLCLIGLFGGASVVTPERQSTEPPVMFDTRCERYPIGGEDYSGTWSNWDCVGNPSDC